MDEERKATRKKLKDVKFKSELLKILQDVNLSDFDYSVAYLTLVAGYDYRYVGDVLGFSERTIKRHMQHILNKLT